ncbi:unnamed protein product, partial [Closterium sp. Naga37s-1]
MAARNQDVSHASLLFLLADLHQPATSMAASLIVSVPLAVAAVGAPLGAWLAEAATLLPHLPSSNPLVTPRPHSPPAHHPCSLDCEHSTGGGSSGDAAGGLLAEAATLLPHLPSSNPLVTPPPHSPPTTIHAALIVSIPLAVAAVGAPLGGWLADVAGRRRAFQIAALPFIAGSLFRCVVGKVHVARNSILGARNPHLISRDLGHVSSALHQHGSLFCLTGGPASGGTPQLVARHVPPGLSPSLPLAARHGTGRTRDPSLAAAAPQHACSSASSSDSERNGGSRRSATGAHVSTTITDVSTTSSTDVCTLSTGASTRRSPARCCCCCCSSCNRRHRHPAHAFAQQQRFCSAPCCLSLPSEIPTSAPPRLSALRPAAVLRNQRCRLLLLPRIPLCWFLLRNRSLCPHRTLQALSCAAGCSSGGFGREKAPSAALFPWHGMLHAVSLGGPVLASPATPCATSLCYRHNH